MVVIPTYNEAANVGPLIDRIFELVPDVRVMVVDDNSPDGTGSIVAGLSKRDKRVKLFSRKGKEGLGKAYIAAFEAILKDQSVGSVLMMDADFSHDPEYIPPMLARGLEASLVVGSRYVSQGRTEGWELWRRALSRWGNRYARLVTGLPIRDCTGGFNLISLDLLRKIDLKAIDMSGYAFIIELKYLLFRAGASVAEVPIVFRNRREGESKISGHIVSEGVIAPWKMRLKK
jgi:dolichol-phosphate mannosyltransferase